MFPLNEYSGRPGLGGTSKRAPLLAGLLKPMRRINNSFQCLPVWLRRYLFAFSQLTLGTALAWLLLNALGAKATLVVSLIGDVVFLGCAWLGYGEGVLAGILITFVIPHLLLPGTPLHPDGGRFGLLLLLSLLVSSISAYKRKAERALKFAADELESRVQSRTLELQRALEEIRASELRFRQLADSMPQIVWTAAPDGVVEYLNQRWYKFTGLGLSDHLTEDIHSIIHPDSLADFVTSWETAVHAKKPYETEIRFLDGATGEYRWFLCRAIPVRDGGMNSIRWFGTFTDIHEQKRIEAAFHRASADLSRFAYSTNHDLQEPLRNVATYSQLLETRYGSGLDAEGTSFIRFISRDAKRMCALITNLTIYTSAGGSSELVPTPSDADAAINKALANLQHVITESQAVIVHTDLPRVGLSENDLRQIFQKLIENAIQYRKADIAPRVEITALRKRAEWIFSVQDNGIGIPAEYTQQIFGVFQRLHGAGQYGSIGMGLAICQKIVEHYSGRIWVESQPGVGSIFSFSVPVAPAFKMLPGQYRIQKTPDVQSNF